ncbi:MAG: D-alanine--poly(phosphoribitol) ligase subunit DltA [Bacillota bacterium]|nr:D-alanine--poly(phosphoribitol) ligase subunit DltA [Bacillota bacterium]
MDFLDEIDSRPSLSIAHIHRDKNMTYGTLKAHSNALAVYLINSFKTDSSPIIVLGEKESLMLVCFLASVKSGHPYIPVDVSMTEKRLESIISNSGAKVVIKTCEKNINDFTGTIIEKIDLERIIIEFNGRIPDINYRVKAEDVFYIIYTSGSTGTPKGVQITKGNLQSFIRWGRSILKGENKIFMNQAPFSFDLSVMDTYLSLTTGSILFSIDKDMISNMPELFQYFNKSGITTWVSTPSFAAMCLQSPSFNNNLLPNLKEMFFCGEVLTKKTAAKLFERFPEIKIINFYGPTEAAVAVTAVEVTEEMMIEEGDLPVGYVKEDCKLKIEESSGEILIIGESVAKGYLNNETETNKHFFIENINGKSVRGYRTGDKGYLKDGLLYYKGRLDFQVKVHGYRIELEDIEYNIRKIPYISNAVILPVIKNDELQYLQSFISLQENYSVEIIEIKEELKKILPEYMIPRKIKIIEKFPMNTNGKIDRKSFMEEL